MDSKPISEASSVKTSANNAAFKAEQTEVIKMKARGMSNNAISYKMNIPLSRVRTHLKN